MDSKYKIGDLLWVKTSNGESLVIYHGPSEIYPDLAFRFRYFNDFSIEYFYLGEWGDIIGRHCPMKPINIIKKVKL